MESNKRGRPPGATIPKKQQKTKPVYLSEELYTELVSVACAEGFPDWREWIDQMLVRRNVAYGKSLLTTLNKEEKDVTN